MAWSISRTAERFLALKMPVLPLPAGAPWSLTS